MQFYNMASNLMPAVISVLVTRNFCKMFLRTRRALEFSHGLGQYLPYAAQRNATYSMTSSARTSRAVGITRSSTFAVRRLMISSVLASCTTGISAGLSPFRTRAV